MPAYKRPGFLNFAKKRIHEEDCYYVICIVIIICF
jgi:hypothetical protein